MKKLFLLFIIGLLCLITIECYGTQIDSNYGKPLIILTETDPWSMVIGSDVPTFALYQKGQVIYKITEKKILTFYEITLNKQELQKLIKSIDISEIIYKQKNKFIASRSTDQPSTTLILNLKRSKSIFIYGDISDKGEARKKIPKEFMKIYDFLKKYKNNKAKVWLPEKIELIFWDYNYAPTKRPWIKGFPNLKTRTTIKFDNDNYSVFIDKKHFGEFKKYFLSLGEKEAVEINGRKMAVSYRFPFPNIK